MMRWSILELDIDLPSYLALFLAFQISQWPYSITARMNRPWAVFWWVLNTFWQINVLTEMGFNYSPKWVKWDQINLAKSLYRKICLIFYSQCNLQRRHLEHKCTPTRWTLLSVGRALDTIFQRRNEILVGSQLYHNLVHGNSWWLGLILVSIR